MDFCSLFFKKPLNQLKYSDIEEYFVNAKIETETIEFKSFNTTDSWERVINDVIRGISSLLNSSGGILIWGAPRASNSNKTDKSFSGNLYPVNVFIEKDRLINKITSLITPLPIGINVNPLSSGTNHVYVFEIQPSIKKPHQFDGRYFIRLDGQTKPAPHYIVEALIKQITYPEIRGYLKFQNVYSNDGKIHLQLSVFIFNLSRFQNEENVSFTLVSSYGFFERSQSIMQDHYKWKYHIIGGRCELRYDNFANILHFGNPYEHSEKLILQPDNKETFTIALTFSGRYSPAKWSKYIIKLKDFDRVNFEHNIVGKDENILFAESITQSDEHLIESHLK